MARRSYSQCDGSILFVVTYKFHMYDGSGFNEHLCIERCHNRNFGIVRCPTGPWESKPSYMRKAGRATKIGTSVQVAHQQRMNLEASLLHT